MEISTIGLPLSFALFIALVLVLPLVRQRWRTGLWAVVVRDTGGSVERFVRGLTVLLFLAIAVWTLLVATLGGAVLGAWAPPPVLAWLGVGLMIAGFVLVIAAQAEMGASWRIGIDDRPTTLVGSGLFRRVRHPIYTGMLAMFAAIVCLTPAPWTICGGLLAYVVIAVQSRLEDDHMLGQHGAAYVAWARRTGRFLPGLGRWRAPNEPVSGVAPTGSAS